MGDAGTNGETEDEADARRLREAVARAETALQRPGLKVEGFLLHGRPGSSIVDEAGAIGADLVVVGSRGHGTIATMLLGSTASEVVDHAPCPVLVARHEHLAPLAFADDGSKSARHAETVFTRWPIFAGLPVSVVTVAEVAVPVAAGFTPGLYDQVLESYTKSVDEARAEVRREADHRGPSPRRRRPRCDAGRPRGRPGDGDRPLSPRARHRHHRDGDARPHRAGAAHPGQHGAQRAGPRSLLGADRPRGRVAPVVRGVGGPRVRRRASGAVRATARCPVRGALGVHGAAAVPDRAQVVLGVLRVADRPAMVDQQHVGRVHLVGLQDPQEQVVRLVRASPSRG